MEKHPSTKAIRTQVPRTGQKEHAAPLYMTSSFVFDDAETMGAVFAGDESGNIYSRFSNPNVAELIDKMCALEGAAAGFATASGMSAVFSTFMALLGQGDHLLACNAIFGGTHTVVSKYLPKYGIDHTYVDAADPASWESAIRPSTRMIYIETPTNPGLEIIDLEIVGELARRHGIILCVDNAFATPYGQRPIDFGADLVIHSATKWIDGQGRTLGGVIVGREDLINEIYLFCRNTGPTLSPFNAWVLSKSLETLEVRMERHAASAFRIATTLEGHPKISWLKYPFLPSHPQHEIAMRQMTSGGGILCFELKGGLEAGRRFLNALEMLSMTANLGDTRSIASHPASTTHSKLTEEERLAANITPGLVRISVGLEHIEDILADIESALEQA